MINIAKAEQESYPGYGVFFAVEHFFRHFETEHGYVFLWRNTEFFDKQSSVMLGIYPRNGVKLFDFEIPFGIMLM